VSSLTRRRQWQQRDSKELLLPGFGFFDISIHVVGVGTFVFFSLCGGGVTSIKISTSCELAKQTRGTPKKPSRYVTVLEVARCGYA
jgi:hypothetical protein